MDFPIGKNLFHLIVNPGTAPSPLPDGTPRCMAAESVTNETGRNHEKRENGTRNSVRNVPTGKQTYLYRFSTFSGNFPVGRTRRNVFHLLPKRNFRSLRKHPFLLALRRWGRFARRRRARRNGCFRRLKFQKFRLHGKRPRSWLVIGGFRSVWSFCSKVRCL